MKTTSKNMIQSRSRGAHHDDIACQKNGKKEAPAEEKFMQPTKTVQYDKILVTSVTDLFFSWRRWPPSWSRMSTLSCYHMMDVVLLFYFF
jgi:hypothetical protein